MAPRITASTFISFLTLRAIVLITIFLAGCIESSTENETSPAYTISGTIQSEEELKLESALVSIDGIEASALTDANGAFTVESDDDFLSSAFLSVSKDGFEPFGSNVNLMGNGNAYEVEATITLYEALPWDYLEIQVTPSSNLQVSQIGTSTGYQSLINSRSSMFAARDNECDCKVTLSGKTYKQGGKKTEAYIVFSVDASGSSAEKTIAEKTVFEMEIEALTSLVNALTEDEKLKVGIVRFATDASLELDFTTDLDAVKNTLSSMSPEEPRTSGAATNYQAALELIVNTFKGEKLKKHDIQTVVFLSDGIPTAPYDSGLTQEKEDRIASIDAASLLKAENIVVNTFPINVISKLTTLPAISAITGGFYYDLASETLADEITQYSLVGLKGLQVVNETTNSETLDFGLSPDGWFSGDVCLSNAGKNRIKITPLVCQDCLKPAYQKIYANCEGEECSNCEGQITMLELRYNGTLEDAQIRVEQSQKNKDGKIIYDDAVSAQGTFVFYGSTKDKTMGPDIKIYINDVLNGEFITSCGEPKTAPGVVSGDFEVVRGYSRNGGLLCAAE